MYTSQRRLWLTLVVTTVIVWQCNAAGQAAAPSLEVFPASDMIRVFEDGYGWTAGPAGELSVLGVRNEILSAQCVVRANANLEGLTVVVSPLQHAENAATLDAESVQWNFVDGIFIEENTPKLVKSDLTRPAPAHFPDVLGQQRELSLAAGSLKTVYLTIRIPRDLPAGEYRGTVGVQAGDARAELPLVVSVYPLTLPDERHVMVTEWFSTNQFQRHHGVDPGDSDAFYRMLAVYAENMAEHRQNVFRVSLGLIRTTRGSDGQLRFDFSAFDRWADVFWNTGRMDLLETGFVARFGEGGWSSTEVRLSDFDVRDESTGKNVRVAGKDFLPTFLPALVAHLREKGWLEKTVFHICDEPSNHNVMAWREASDFVHRHAPELRRIDAIETTHCLDRLEIWVPKLDHLATWQPAYEEAQRRGNELWHYTVGIFQQGSLPNKTADVALIESRILHWLNYRYGLSGYLHWGWNVWTEDPIGAPGRHRGDGWHVYPTQGGVLNSLRWEQMRNGLQDYECLWLLESKLAAVKATALSPRIAELIEPRRRGVEIATQVVSTYSQFTRDPEILLAARRQAIEEAVDLDVKPRVVLQTNPLEHSAVANNCAIDVHGWAEPGSTLKINGRETSVAEDGLFLAQVPPSREGTITVEAVHGEARKSLVRRFRLAHDPSGGPVLSRSARVAP